MGEVISYTKAGIDELIDATFINAELVGDDLVLTRKDESTVTIPLPSGGEGDVTEAEMNDAIAAAITALINAAPAEGDTLSEIYNLVLTLSTLISGNYQETDDYTLVLSDGGKIVRMDDPGPNTVTIPPNSSVAFPVGTVSGVMQYGAGQTSIVAGAGVTLRAPDGLDIGEQYGSAAFWQIAIDEWEVKVDAADESGGAVASVFGRTDAVVAEPGDYSADQITFTPFGAFTETEVQAAIEEIATALAGLITAHDAATTDVHGIPDTDDLVYTDDVRLTDETIAGVAYNPANNTTIITTSSTTLVDIDATNAVLTFIVPASGKVEIELEVMCDAEQNTVCHLGLREGTTAIATTWARSTPNTVTFSTVRHRASFFLTGLTPGATKTYKAAIHRSGSGAVHAYAGNGTSNNGVNAYGPLVMKAKRCDFLA